LNIFQRSREIIKMPLPEFLYHVPATLNEACQLMAQLGEDGRPLAGGTDLIVNMRKGLISPKNVVSLGRIEELNKIDHSGGLTRVGACLKVSDLVRSKPVSSRYNALRLGAGSLGSPLIRNLATIGGNLVTGRPAADLPPPLMALGARLLFRSVSGKREVPLQEFFHGPGLTAIGKDEILTEILLPEPPSNSGSGYIKLGVRKALEISIVNAASFISLDRESGKIRSARVVLGAVAPTPIRAWSAEKILIGEKPDEELFIKAGEAASEESKPIDDFRGSAGYRRDMVKILTQRSLHIAFDDLMSNTLERWDEKNDHAHCK
jgi:CO/xanthine dehydrogenase FAD-binding subunit